MFSLAVRSVGEPKCWRRVLACRAILADVGPQAGRSGLAHAWSQHRHRRIVGVDLFVRQHVAANLVHQGSEQMAGRAHPVGQCGAVQIDTVAGEDLRLAIQGKVVGVLGEPDMGQKIGPASPRSMGRDGAGAWTIVSHRVQAIFTRTWRITL